MNKAIQYFKKYFDVDEINIDKKVVIIYISAALLIVLGEYYDSTIEIKEFITNLLGQNISDKFMQYSLINNDYSLQNLLFWGINCVFVFLLIPMLIVKFVLKENLTDYGFQIKGIKKHLWIYLVLIAIMFPIVFIVSKSSVFLQQYPFYHITDKSQLHNFFIWEIIYVLQFVSIEFFFRGFLLHGVKHKFGYYAILFAVIPYCMIHFGKPVSETTGAIIAGCVLGFLSLNTNSILLGIIVHVTIALTMDFCALWRSGLFNN